MRITFLGKGGSGKTTLATSFIKYLEKKGKKSLGYRCRHKCKFGCCFKYA